VLKSCCQTEAERTSCRHTNLGCEVQLTDGIGSLLADEQVLAYRYVGTRFHCGSRLGYLKATIQFTLRHPEVRQDLEKFARESVGAHA
jgi:UTP--glucose-1-phosphate uridylyltransferase